LQEIAPMLPADTIAEITINLAALNLQPSTAAQILAAVLAPLMRTTETPPAGLEPAGSKPTRRPRSSKRARGGRRKRKYRRHAPSEARDRALAALRANPNATPTEIAKLAKVSRSTAVHARKALDAEARKAARRSRKTTPSTISKPAERRQRAQRFLKDTLAQGPKPVTAVEEAAAKAHVDPTALEQARADLGIVASRSNAGGVQAVQWSLPG
jgi:hypothetical protein